MSWQVWIHLRRQALLSYRDPTLYLGRMVMFLICSVFFAWVYVKSRDRNQAQAIYCSLLMGNRFSFMLRGTMGV